MVSAIELASEHEKEGFRKSVLAQGLNTEKLPDKLHAIHSKK